MASAISEDQWLLSRYGENCFGIDEAGLTSKLDVMSARVVSTL